MEPFFFREKCLHRHSRLSKAGLSSPLSLMCVNLNIRTGIMEISKLCELVAQNYCISETIIKHLCSGIYALHLKVTQQIPKRLRKM